MDISITKTIKTNTGWAITALLDETEFSVQVDRDYWQELTDGDIEVEELVRKSFAFLLEHEQKSMILRNFNLRVIESYFPEYPKRFKIK